MLLISVITKENETFTYPVLIEFEKDLNTYLILSDEKRIIDNHKTYFTKNNLPINLKTFLLNENKIDNVKTILNEIEKITDNYDKVYFNSTLTDNIISIIFGNIVMKKSGVILNYNKDNKIEVLYNGSYEKLDIRRNLKLEEHITLKGYKIESKSSQSEIIKRKEVIFEIFENFHTIRAYNKFKLTWGTDKYVSNPINKKIENLLKSIDKLEDNYYISGDLFEEYVFLILIETKLFDDPEMSVEINFQGFKNEFDIFTIKNNKIYNIECKHRKKFNREHFLYKADSTHNLLDEDGNRVIISLSDNKNFTNNQYNRAEDREIKILETKNMIKEKLIKFFNQMIKEEK